MHESILTFIPEVMISNFMIEDLGNIKTNLGNVQKCHPKYDQLASMLS